MRGTKVPTMHPDLHRGDALYMSCHASDGLHIGVNGNEHTFAAGVIVTRTDFLAAVQSELSVRLVPADSIVIERGELPEVTVDGDSRTLWVDGLAYSKRFDPAELRAIGVRALAAADHLAHPPVPPVDEDDVAALAEEIKASDIARYRGVLLMAAYRETARNPLATGKVTVTRS
jgi:hypothetical protein